MGCLKIQEGRDPAYYPLLNRQPLREFVRRNPRTLTEKQKLEGVKFQYFTDRYRQIWSLTKESEAGNSPVVKGLNSPLDPYLDLKHEFEGMLNLGDEALVRLRNLIQQRVQNHHEKDHDESHCDPFA